VELCEDDDFLVLACDGIWDCMSSQQLVDFVLEQLKTKNWRMDVCPSLIVTRALIYHGKLTSGGVMTNEVPTIIRLP
ncbi:probable protein phosphatase 2C 60, partial [Tanacetum coccineum]